MAGLVFGQSLPYDAADPEGIQIWPNKMGRYPWKRRGIFLVEKLYAPTGNPGRAPAVQATPTASTGLVG